MKRLNTVTKKIKKIQRQLKKTFSKKKNQRKLAYLICITLIIGLGSGLILQTTQNVQARKQLQQTLQVKEQKLETVSKDLQELKKEASTKDTELQEKARREAELKAEIEKIQQELQAKRETEKTLANTFIDVASTPASTNFKGGDPGNTYAAGNCTYGVASWVPVPNNWGNANAWASNARSQGYTVSPTPKVGSVATTTAGYYGHVALVIGVTGNTVTIQEMNYAGFGIVSSRSASISEFQYIYI